MALSRRRVTDSDSLKALAHPLRLSLLEVLVSDGPKTASQAAVLVGGSPSNCSWHLRKLAEFGFVREVAGARGRSRPWRVVREGLVWGDEGDQAPASAANEGAADLRLERELQRYRAARSQRDAEPADWRAATGLSQVQLWLTAEESREFRQSLAELAASKANRHEHGAERPEGVRLVSVVSWLAPHGPYAPGD